MRALLLQAVVGLALPLFGQTQGAQQPDEQDPPDNQALSRALCEAQDRGEFSVADALGKLSLKNDFVASTAAAIVRHEWAELSHAFFAGLDANPVAARRFLEELVVAPRPAAAKWVVEQTKPRHKRSLNHRLLALAARRQPLTKAEALLLLDVASTGKAGDGFYYAAAHVSEQVADRLIGRIHQGLSQLQIDVGDIGPLLDRLSLRGTKSLLGLALTLPPDTARQLLRHVYDVRPELVQNRVAAALDGKIPLDALWLEFGRKLLDREDRVDRVVSLLVDSESGAVRDRAFELLLTEGALEQRSLQVIKEAGSERDIRRLIARAVNQLPSSYVLEWLQGSPRVSEEMTRALATRKVLQPEIQKHLLEMLDGFGSANSHTPLHAVTALVHAGDAESLKTIWPLVMGSTSWRDLLYRLGQRTEPFTYELMLAAIMAAAKQEPRSDVPEAEADLQQQKLDMLRLLLVARGDRRELDQLLQNAPKRRASFVRRCRHYADKLTEQQANSLFDAALLCEDPEVGAELLEWAAHAQRQAIGDRLWQLWSDSPELDSIEELQDTAMRLLATGAKRGELLAEMRAAAKQGPLPDRLSALPYELLNTMSRPLHADSVTLCAELLLQLPLEDAEGEQRRARRWPNGTSGYPLVAAIAHRLRGADLELVEQVFTKTVDELQGDPRSANISRQRLKVFWRSMAFEADMQRPLGRITSRLWLFHDGRDGVSEGAAIWFQAQHHEHLGDFVRAETLYRKAAQLLLRLPSMRGEARWLLGERNPAAGRDPLAALAAAPYRMRLLAATKAGDVQAASKATSLLREFAGYDRDTLDTLIDTPVESGR